MVVKAFSSEYFKLLKNIRKRPIIFFNGCFDIVHNGHLKLINKVIGLKKEYPSATIVICAINSDESVKKQNKQHPLINNENDRAEFLKLLGIDYVIIFDEESPLQLIMNIMPDEVVTTSQYAHNKNCKDIVFCRNHDIEVGYIMIEKEYSTTKIYNKIEEQVKAKIKENL